MSEVPYGAPTDDAWIEDASLPTLKRTHYLERVFGEEPPQGYAEWIKSLSLTSVEMEYFKRKLLGQLIDKLLITGVVPFTSDLPQSGNNNGDIWFVESDGHAHLWLDGNYYDLGDLKGVKGDQGIQGIQGEVGPIGPKGDQGIQGIKGDTGETGAQGIQGPKGDTGLTGPKGDQGIQGIPGENGADGTSVTIKGSVATSAELPTTGNSNGDGWITQGDGHLHVWNGTAFVDVGLVRGPKGDKGDTGAQGIQGIQGIPGVKGDTGDQGIQGIQGVKGDQGEIGPIGPKGDKGDGITYLSTAPNAEAKQNTYPFGYSYFVLSSNSGTGWPIGYFVAETVNVNASRCYQTLRSTNGKLEYYRTVNSGTGEWNPFEIISGVVENTPDTIVRRNIDGTFQVNFDPLADNHPASKRYVDRSNTLGYQNKLAADLPNTYPEGVTVGLFSVSSGGFPALGAAFDVVETIVPRSYSGVVQHAYPYVQASLDDAARQSLTGCYAYRYGQADKWTDWVYVIPPLTPEQFGAKGNDSTDDTAAFQQAFNVAVATGRGIVLDGTKTYRVTKGIVTPAITKPTNFSIESINGIATLHSVDQTTVAVMEIAGSPNGTARTVTQNVDAQANSFVISGVASTLPDGTLYVMESVKPWYYDPRTESTDARRSELHVQSSRSANTIRTLGTFAESYSASADTLSVQPYIPIRVSIKGLRIVRDLPPVAEESARHGLLRISHSVDSIIEDIYLDGGTEYGMSLRNNYGIRVKGGAATNCNNYWTGYGISVAGSHFFDISGMKITNTRRGVDVTQGGKTVSRYGKIHDNFVIGGGVNSRGDIYGWNLNGSTAAQQSGMGSHGAADMIEYYNNTFIRLHDPITLRGGNESIINNTVWGKTVNGAFSVAHGGGTILVQGNKCAIGTETGPYSGTNYNDPTSDLGSEFLKVYSSINPSMHLIVQDNICEVQKDFIVISDAQVAVPLRMTVKDNTVLYRTTEANVYLVSNESSQGLYSYPASAYRQTFALNRQSILVGSSTVNFTKNINMSNAKILEYDTSGATT